MADKQTSVTSWVEALIREGGPVTARTMLGMRTFLDKGKMFAALGEGELLLKLPNTTRENLVTQGLTSTLPTGAGLAFGDWVALPLTLWEHRQSEFKTLAEESRSYALQPPPPPPPREERHYRKRMY